MLVHSCSRSFAKRVFSVLAKHGYVGRAQPVVELPAAAAPEPRRGGFLKLLVLVILVGGGLAGGYLYSTSGLPAHLAAKTPVVAVPTKSIAAGALPSTAAVRCARSVGAGFFITEDLLVTNAHVVCPAGEPMRIKMQDGRDLLGQAKKMDDWLDVALVQVLGAAAKPLPLGDAGQVAVGEKVVFIGAPQGFDFTVHEATVSFVGRNQLGVAYLQFDGTVNPGNSGGPLVTDDGKVVGVVSMKILGGEGMGLALPANYLVEGERAVRPELATGPSSPEWKAVLEKANKADEEEIRKVATAFVRPGLIFARAAPGKGAVAVLLQRAKEPPRATNVSFKLRRGGKEVCQDVRRVSDWELLEGVQNGDATGARWVKWLRQRGLSRSLYVGVAVMEARCFMDDLSGTSLVLEDADEFASSIPL
ncbi:MAG: S1C family serine protease [Myxococcales bacterium]